MSDIELISATVLKAAAPLRSIEDMEKWVAPLKKSCAEYEIDSIRRISSFIAQMAHESGLIAEREENLYYSAKRLTEVWPHRFPTLESAEKYANNPMALANHVYANRMGNGNEQSCDGWRFRGMGPLCLTGRANWTAFAAKMKMSIPEALAYGRTIEGGIATAAWFWDKNCINRFADTPDVSDESRAINGGMTGLNDRRKRYNAVHKELTRLKNAK